MIRLASLRILVLIALSIALIGIPQSSFAQHGGHGGGGGFHGGGGAFHGGGNFGGFHGGAAWFHGSGYGAFHSGGYYGFHGHGFRGGPFFGGLGFPGYGFGFGFGFSPYWGYPYWGYPYSYGYGPWGNPYAYYYPYDPYYYQDGPGSRDGRYPRGNRDGCDYRYEDEHPCKSQKKNAPPRPSSTVPKSSPQHNYVTTNPAANDSAFSLADYRPSSSTNPADATAPVASNHQLINPTTSQLPSGLRPAVRNAIQALRAMPPDARQRQLNSGRYHSLSPEELEFVTNATQLPQALTAR